MPSAIPSATYRLQLIPTFGFDDAAAAVPYLKALGITHVYASPFLKARSGSTHGYDVVDYNSLNPELGGEAGFRRFRAALDAADMGLILDFVPNHMAVHGCDNPWWLDVLEWGPRSPFAQFFDIDWRALPYRRRACVLVPVLGQPYAEVLRAGKIELRYDRKDGSFSAWYFANRFPIAPECYGEILQTVIMFSSAVDGPGAHRLRELAAASPARSTGQEATFRFKSELAAVRGGETIIRQGLAAYRAAADRADAIRKLHALLERQHYRLAHWRLAATQINYRRFFDITSLAGVTPENPAAFTAIHHLVGRMIAKGEIQGLRLDHIDGLRDPAKYCRDLQQFIAAARPSDRKSFYVIVEKILAEGERLPRFPGVTGTTGYEWLNMISRVLIDARGQAALDRAWRQSSGSDLAFDAILMATKRYVMWNVLASEFSGLCRALAQIGVGQYASRDHGAERLAAALELYVLHFPIYRTYIDAGGAGESDRLIIDETIERARAEWSGPDAVFNLLRDALTLDLAGRRGYGAARVREFARKVQQFTGPMMAKSLEDTAFYRYHRLLALNEVGGDPATWDIPVSDFHDRMADRAVTAPRGLTATTTHDTKRGEDARARLLALSELADDWAEAVPQWKNSMPPPWHHQADRTPQRRRMNTCSTKRCSARGRSKA